MFRPSRPSNKLCHWHVSIQLAYISCCYVRQTSGKLSGCHEPLFQRYAYSLNMLVNRSIGKKILQNLTNFKFTQQNNLICIAFNSIFLVHKEVCIVYIPGSSAIQLEQLVEKYLIQFRELLPEVLLHDLVFRDPDVIGVSVLFHQLLGLCACSHTLGLEKKRLTFITVYVIIKLLFETNWIWKH